LRRKLELLLGAALAAHAPWAMAASTANPRTDRLPQPASTGPAAQPEFAPPSEPMILTRELRRALGDGQQVVSRRSYAVRFVPAPGGWTVEGELVGTEVEAPPTVPAQLVALERQRGDGGLFPLGLDAHGMIVSQHGDHDPAVSAQAMAVVTASLAASTLSEADRAAALAMAQRIRAQASAAGGNWPVDLFRPSPGERSEVRQIPLGNGVEGRVTVTTAGAIADQDHAALIERFERKVLTETGGTSRLSVETWTLRHLR